MEIPVARLFELYGRAQAEVELLRAENAELRKQVVAHERAAFAEREAPPSPTT